MPDKPINRKPGSGQDSSCIGINVGTCYHQQVYVKPLTRLYREKV